MVTTRSQEKRGHDTPEPSSIVVDISAAPESKTPSTASKKRTTPRAKAAQDTDARKGLEKDAESEKSSLVHDGDATPTANNKTVPYRQKATESFFTPAQTPANKRKRFTSEELEDSTLDTFETPAEHPQSRHEHATTTEEEHADDDDAPEVVSSKTAAEQVRALRSRGPSSAGRKRRRTAVDQEPATLESDTIEVLSTTATTNEKPVQVGTDEAALSSDGTAINDQPGAEVTTVQVDEESTHQTDNTNASIIVETATTQHEKDDQTQEPPPASDNATKPVDEEETTPTRPTEETEGKPSDDQATISDTPLPERTTTEVQPLDELEASPPEDLPLFTLSKHTSALSSAPETQGTPDTTSAQPTLPTPPSRAAKSAPEPSPHHRPLSGSSLLERKANPPKPSTSILSQRQRAAILREHRPAQKPLTTSSLDAYRSRVLDRHPRTSAWGAPGQRKVRFVGA